MKTAADNIVQSCLLVCKN